MRPIHLAPLDETRPVLVLTRELVRPHLSRATVASITSTIRGLSTEVRVERARPRRSSATALILAADGGTAKSRGTVAH